MTSSKSWPRSSSRTTGLETRKLSSWTWKSRSKVETPPLSESALTQLHDLLFSSTPTLKWTSIAAVHFNSSAGCMRPQATELPRPPLCAPTERFFSLPLSLTCARRGRMRIYFVLSLIGMGHWCLSSLCSTFSPRFAKQKRSLNFRT